MSSVDASLTSMIPDRSSANQLNVGVATLMCLVPWARSVAGPVDTSSGRASAVTARDTLLRIAAGAADTKAALTAARLRTFFASLVTGSHGSRAGFTFHVLPDGAQPTEPVTESPVGSAWHVACGFTPREAKDRA